MCLNKRRLFDRQTDRDIGISILRLWMVFEVVLVHYWDTTTGNVSIWLKPFEEMKMLAVPIFMLLSFI